MVNSDSRLQRIAMVFVAFLALLCTLVLVRYVVHLDRAYAKESESIYLAPSADWFLVMTLPNDMEAQKEELLDIIRDEKLIETLQSRPAIGYSEEWIEEQSTAYEDLVKKITLSDELEAKYHDRDEVLGEQYGERFEELLPVWNAILAERAREEALRVNAERKGLVYAKNEAFCMELSAKEYECLLRIVQAEAADEPLEGKILVANVVLNRVLSGRFPNSVTGVVFQEGQFSPIRDGAYNRAKPSAETKEAVARALAGEDYSQGALYFFARRLTTASKANWFDTCLEKVVKFEGHEFYK